MIKRTPVLVAHDGRQFALERDGLHTIGAQNCSVLLDDESVSPKHAALIIARERIMLRAEEGDVWLNGAPVSGMAQLQEQDVITIGAFNLQLYFVDQQAAAPSAGSRFMPSPAADAFRLSDPMSEPPIPQGGPAIVYPQIPPRPTPAGAATDDEAVQPAAPPSAPVPPVPPAAPVPAAAHVEEGDEDYDPFEDEGAEEAHVPGVTTLPVPEDDDESLPESAALADDEEEDADDALAEDHYAAQPEAEIAADESEADDAYEQAYAAAEDDATDDDAAGAVPEEDTGKAERAVQPAPPSDALDEVFFTCYYPREAPARARHNVIVYAHIQQAIERIGQDARQVMRAQESEMPRPRPDPDAAQIAPGAPLTVTIDCPHLAFTPAMLTHTWEDDEWLRFGFTFDAPPELEGHIVNAHVVVLIQGIEIACIRNCAIEIVPATTGDDDAPAPARITRKAARLHQSIFVSYSRDDEAVIDAYRLAQMVLGRDLFMDTYSVRQGDDWGAILADALDEADIMQLFWSPNAALSPYVQAEWQYALVYRCPQTRCEGFIRPVVWDDAPAPPAELAHLHFRRVDLGPGG